MTNDNYRQVVDDHYKQLTWQIILGKLEKRNNDHIVKMKPVYLRVNIVVDIIGFLLFGFIGIIIGEIIGFVIDKLIFQYIGWDSLYTQYSKLTSIEVALLNDVLYKYKYAIDKSNPDDILFRVIGRIIRKINRLRIVKPHAE